MYYPNHGCPLGMGDADDDDGDADSVLRVDWVDIPAREVKSGIDHVHVFLTWYLYSYYFCHFSHYRHFCLYYVKKNAATLTIAYGGGLFLPVEHSCHVPMGNLH